MKEEKKITIKNVKIGVYNYYITFVEKPYSVICKKDLSVINCNCVNGSNYGINNKQICYHKKKALRYLNELNSNMKGVQETSLEAFMEEKDKSFPVQRDRVFNYILSNPKCTDRDIANGLQLEINSINGRRNELLKKNKIICNGKIKSSYTGKSVLCWSVC